MPRAFDKVAFAMEKGAVSEVVKTKFGYHIIKLSDKKSAGVAPYEEVRDFIEKFLQQQESEKKRAAHIAELKKKAKIEIFPNDLDGSSSGGLENGAGTGIATSSSETPSPAPR